MLFDITKEYWNGLSVGTPTVTLVMLLSNYSNSGYVIQLTRLTLVVLLNKTKEYWDRLPVGTHTVTLIMLFSNNNNSGYVIQ